jgi:putative ABC transport system permease protein
VLVLPVETDLSNYYARGHSEYTLPAEYVERLEDQEVANRLVPMLRRRVAVQATGQASGLEVLLTGIGEEVFKGGQNKKAVFGMRLEEGEVVVGGEVAALMGLERGDSLRILGEDLRVKRALTRAGSEEDVTVYGNLMTVQRLLGLEGRINEIQALECHCDATVSDPLALLRTQLEGLLPGTRVLRRAALADARRVQRLAAEELLSAATPAALSLAGLLVALLAWLNARERRAELGLLRTLGSSAVGMALFVVGRTAILGLIGAALGTWVGVAASAQLIARIYSVGAATTGDTAILWSLGLLLAPLCASLAALVPVAWALRADPAEVLSID